MKLTNNLLLCRPWIYKIRIVTSTIHRSMKFMYKDKQITIHAEDNPMNVCQEVERFWIPHDLVESEEDTPTFVSDVSP